MLENAGAATYTLQFVTNRPPIAGFTVTAGNISAIEGQSVSVRTPAGTSASVAFSAGRSTAPNGSIVGWQWVLDGTAISSSSSFNESLNVGVHIIKLVVSDNLGLKSTPATATIVVAAVGLRPTIFFDGSQDTQQRFLFASFQPPVVDSTGNLLFVSTHFGFSCSFNQCGIRANSIAPSGQLNWQSPNDGTFISFNIEGGIAVGQNDQLFIPGFSATMFSLDSSGVPVKGWPVSVGPQHFEGPIIADKRLGTVYSSGITSSSFSGFPATVMALNPDGSLKWRDDYPFGRLNLLQGPNRDIYTLQQGNVLLGLDHGSGIQFCNQTFDFSFRLDSLVAGPDGLFASAGADVFVIGANCSSTKIFTGNNTNSLTAYADSVLYAFDIPNANDPTQSRLMAVSNAGVLLWKDSRIQFPTVQIAKNGLAYVLGQDTQDSLIPKLFVIDATTGIVLDAADTTQICTGCAVAVADDGSIYISQLGATKIFKLN